MSRSKMLAPLVVIVFTVAAFAAVALLMQRADASRQQQIHAIAVTKAVATLSQAGFSADPSAGGSPAASRRLIQDTERTILAGLSPASQPGVPSTLLDAGRARLADLEPTVDSIYAIAVGPGGLRGPNSGGLIGLQKQVLAQSAALSGILDRVSQLDAVNASNARRNAQLGTAGALIALLAIFVVFYVRSARAHKVVERLAHENDQLLTASRKDATSDMLTGLANRRALEVDLAEGAKAAAEGPELLLAIFDLDGFKQYNDSFGHPAGDALLQRLGARLGAALAGRGSTYRMGGDEFCVLCRCTAADAEKVLAAASAALTDSGDGWEIGCSYGAAWMPSEAASPSDAMRLADQRMYANKASRASASRQLTDVLLQVISEQDIDLDQHVENVARLSSSVAEALGQPEHEVQRIRLAATLHDVGKTAIPAGILSKPGPLTAQERTFIDQHTLIGERIVLSAPALAATAPIIRSSHERVDGMGYPDGLAGEEIPLGSRIIAVCDAFDAMTAARPYRGPITAEEALLELDRCKGSQFDPEVVDAFVHCQAAAGAVHSPGAEIHGR